MPKINFVWINLITLKLELNKTLDCHFLYCQSFGFSYLTQECTLQRSNQHFFQNIVEGDNFFSDYKKEILKNISNLCSLNISRINIKAKTTEKLGVIGKEKAIAAEVIVSVIKYV